MHAYGPLVAPVDLCEVCVLGSFVIPGTDTSLPGETWESIASASTDISYPKKIAINLCSALKERHPTWSPAILRLDGLIHGIPDSDYSKCFDSSEVSIEVPLGGDSASSSVSHSGAHRENPDLPSALDTSLASDLRSQLSCKVWDLAEKKQEHINALQNSHDLLANSFDDLENSYIESLRTMQSECMNLLSNSFVEVANGMN